MTTKDLSKYSGSDEVIKISVLKAELDKLPKQPSLFTGLSWLDETIEFFKSGEIVVVSGPPGHGKTTFARFMITKFSEFDYKPIYFGMEGGVSNFFEKFPDPKSLPNFYMSREFIKSSIAWFKDRVIEGKQKYGCKVAFIDHLHYLLDVFSSEDRNNSLYIGQFMRELVTFAKEQDILIFLLAHTNKSTFAKAPNLGDIRDSSFIAQEADIVMFFWRQQIMDEETGEIEFIANESKMSIAKNRRSGILKTFQLMYKEGIFSLKPKGFPLD